MTQEEEYEIYGLVNYVKVSTFLCCRWCGETQHLQGLSRLEAAREFYRLGWHRSSHGVRCPSCRHGVTESVLDRRKAVRGAK